MNRLKLLAVATLLMVPIACGDPVDPPPPTGAIDGLVSIEGQGVDGISVTLSNGGSAITANGGMYRFDDVEAGAYTVTISNYPDDASFNQTSAAATITTDGETVTVNFPGSWIRTSSIMGTVTVENEGLSGITVKLSGVSNSETLTDGTGQYAFTGLRAGNYTIEISGFDDEDVAFGSTTSTATLAVGESKVVSFEGTYLRTSGIMGQVTADDQPQEGITVSLQGRGENKTVTTNGAGQFAFEQLRRGDYSVGISGYDTDEMTFDVTSQSVTVAYGETANVPFEGVLLRTAGIQGTVMVEGVGPVADVTVTIQGEGETHEDMTDNMGAYAFAKLPAGDYSVVISGFDDDQYGFPDGTSATVTVELQETRTVPFDGIMLRTAAIEGTVTVGDDDAPLPGVMVTVNGGPKDEEHSTTTNDDGMYMVENLHAGVYSVSISGYDTNEYGFNPTTESVDVGLRETADVAFQGDLLRTAGVSGRVHVNGMGIEGVTVTMTGEEDRMGMTDADGQYGFSGLAAGDYTLTISGWDEVEYHFEPTMEITLELDESMNGVNFAGKALRTATVMGSVMVEGDALPGIAVTLIKVISANSGEIIGATATDDMGAYSFGPLLAGAYQVMIAGYADEHDFAAGTTQTTTVMTDGTAEVNFMATIIRTASVSGMVTVDGEAMEGVTVTLTGDHAGDDNSMMTGADGMYSFGGLRKGDYTVTVTNPDEETYSFPATSQSVNLSVGQEQGGISFAGARLKQASISGQVHAEGDAVEGVMVTLSGDADGEDMTDANGEYNFPGLAGGDYMVAIAGWDEDAYEFATTEAAVEGLGTDEFRIQDFMGMHTRTASIGGMLYINAGDKPVLDLDDVLPMGAPGLPIKLLGPELGDEMDGFASREGMYAFEDLRAGSYVLSVDVETEIPLPSGDTTTVEAVLAMLGYKYTGESLYNVTVAAAEEGTQNLPFEITMQTINVGAVMGTAGPNGASETVVAGVELALFATTEANSPMLGTGTTDSTGVATIHFPRAMDLGPGGTGNDHLVFAKVTSTGHDDLVVSDNADIEIEYEATDRVSHALTAVRLLNNRANFQWWVKSNETAKHGNEFLGGWTATNGMETDTTGLATYTGVVDVADLPMKFTVALDTMGQPDMGEKWKASGMLTHEHTGLEHPDMNKAEMNDLGPIYVTWTTQRLVLGVYREADDVEGYSDYRSPGLARGDHRPNTGVGNDMEVELLVRDDRNRLRTLEYDHDFDDETDPIEARGDFRAGGLTTFTHLPANLEITARFSVGANRVLVSEYRDIETFGQDLDLGTTVGAFGAMSGAGPEVRLCTESSESTDEWCATYAYQWMTGMVSGDVGDERGHAVMLEPTTGHGAKGDSTGTSGDNANTEANEAGNYAVYGLQDGEYEVTAISGSEDYSIAVTPANPNPTTVTVYHDEYADEEDEMGVDTTWVGTRGADSASWATTRQGLSVRGYVGNDDGDNLMRGDEAIEGVTLTLYRGGRISTVTRRLTGATRVASTTTDASGYYAFDNLADAGATYRVRASSGSGYEAWRSLPNLTRPYENALSGSTRAMVYPELPSDTDLDKPQWTGSAMVNSTSLYTDDQGTDDTDDDVTGTWQNFALVWENGTVAGVVSNSSGSNGNIDVRITTPLGGAPEEVTTGSSGGFELANVLEGSYTATIEDVGWAAPKVDSTTGMPDDDAADWDSDGNGTVDPGEGTAPTQLTGNVTGRNDYEGLGTLHVYSTTASANDTLGAAVRVRWRQHGTDAAGYNDTTSTDATGGWTRSADTDTTSNTTNIGTISWQSERVTFVFGTRNGAIPTGAGVELEAANGECSGASCEVGFFATGDATGGADAREDTITVMVTSANGYDDHAYTLLVSRQNPAGNDIAAANIARSDTTDLTTHTAADAGANGFTFTTTGASSVNLIFTLDTFGDEANDNAYCAQRVSVRATGGNLIPAQEDDDDDVCPDTRYRLSASAGDGTPYTVTITSEDGKTQDYSLRVIDP